MSFYKKISDAIVSTWPGNDAVALAKVARDAVMSAAKRLFEHKGVGLDDDITLIELIHSPVVEEFVGTAEAVAALDFVRILGTNADHERGVKKTRAAQAAKTALDFAALVGFDNCFYFLKLTGFCNRASAEFANDAICHGDVPFVKKTFFCKK